MAPGILDRIIESKRRSIEGKKLSLPIDDLMSRGALNRQARKNFKESIKNEGRISVIAEIKKASPSAGQIRSEFEPSGIIMSYREAGADAVSVVTEEDYFYGSPATLPLVKKLSGLPALMKDFIIDPYQLHEALFWGADAVLLIAGILPGGKLEHFVQQAGEIGLDSLVEVRGREEIDRAVSAGAGIIGVNNRNLETFEVSIQASLELLKFIPENAVKVSESGIHTGKDLRMLREAGADAVLIGEALMRAESPGGKLREILSSA